MKNKTRIVNLTQHDASVEQKEGGVFEPHQKEKVKSCLTFSSLPDREEIQKRALRLAQIAESEKVDSAMIGGAPYLMSALEEALIKKGINPLYAFSKRESIEKTLPDGGVEKTQVFRHLGFVEVKK